MSLTTVGLLKIDILKGLDDNNLEEVEISDQKYPGTCLCRRQFHTNDISSQHFSAKLSIKYFWSRSTKFFLEGFLETSAFSIILQNCTVWTEYIMSFESISGVSNFRQKLNNTVICPNKNIWMPKSCICTDIRSHYYYDRY